MLRAVVLIGLFLCADVQAAGASHVLDSVVRIRAVAADGSVNLGSGVAVDAEQVATACHVTRGAATIEVTQGTKRWNASEQVGSALHDLCVLRVAGVGLPDIHARPSAHLRPGEAVFAVGFEAGDKDRVVRSGVIAALYPYDGGYIIRTNAAFDFGASGGALFDAAGNLVGILAFKARTGEGLRFALPMDWLSPVSPVAAAFVTLSGAASVSAFWERPQGDRPDFLGVALREAAAPQ